MRHVLDRPHQLRHEALDRVLASVGADAAQYYLVARGPDQLLRIHGCRGVGANPEAERRWRGGEGMPMVLSDADPDHIAPLNHFAEPHNDLYTVPVVRFAFLEVGYHGLLSSNITVLDAHRGCIALARAAPPPWNVAPATLAAATTVIATAFRAAWVDELALAPPTGVVDLDEDGTLTGDPAVLAWAARHDFASWARARLDETRLVSAFGEPALHWAPGSVLRLTPHVRGGATCALDQVTPMVLPPVLTELTPTLKRVASLAAAGATVAEIARETDRSPETIKESLAKVYARLGVTSRAELASLARRMLH